MPEISIIVPIYNVEPYIETCLKSLVGQTFRDTEIVCVDDCGTDASMDMVQRFAEKDNRIRIVRHQVNKGLSAARNTGLNVVRSPYVMFCDSDDFYAPDMCEKMYRAIQTFGCDVAICATNIIYEKNEDWRASDDYYYSLKFNGKQNVSMRVLKNTDVSMWNKIFKKEIIDKYEIRFPEGLKFEDAFFFNAYAVFAKTAFFLNEKLYNYKRRQGSIMEETFNKKNSDSIHHLEIAIKLHEFYRKWGMLESWYEYFAEFFVGYYDLALAHAVTERDTNRVNERGAAFAKEWLKDTDLLPLPLKERIERIKYNQDNGNGKFPVRIKRSSNRVKYYFMGVPVFSVKYGERCDRYSVLGIRVYKRAREQMPQ